MTNMTVKDGPGVMEFIFSKRLDSDVCKTLEPKILNKVKNNHTVIVFDLEKVDYISSAFLGICLAVFKKVGDAKFSIMNVAPEVKKVFKIAGFDFNMKIF
ncbi:STAS domain-containing protein [candidate division KSB1 bacterium]|nr:STAS domain-containing protein [candidate division KSB1 bacterium]